MVMKCSHVLVYWKTHGVIPKDDEVIHHKDGNRFNNNPDNLVLMTNKDHVKMHGKKRGCKLVKLKCPGCGKVFIKERNKTFLSKGGQYACCSRKCVGIASNLPTTELQKRIDRNVIKEFIGDKTRYNL